MSDQPPVNLNVTDISDAVKVIDHACDQGAFRGWENIRQILALRDRLDMFSTAAAAIANPTPSEPTEETTDQPLEALADESDVMVEETTKPKMTHARRQRGGRMSART
jgi:hypothetical protein